MLNMLNIFKPYNSTQSNNINTCHHKPQSCHCERQQSNPENVMHNGLPRSAKASLAMTMFNYKLRSRHCEFYSCRCERPTGARQSASFPVIACSAKQRSRHPELNIFYHPKRRSHHLERRSRHPELVSGSNQQRCKKSIINKMLNLVQHDGIINLKNPRKQAAFSLVEMLMALLVASLLMAALAPVMTRRMANQEIKVMSEAADYDKDTVISVFSKDTDFTIPTDANQVRITMMGGGGAGGDALYGNKEFTSSQNFTIPDNVTKLRVFMVGAGGGGASGGRGDTWVTVNGEDTYKDFVTNNEESFSKIVPELDTNCTASGATKWISAVDSTKTYSPNTSYLSSIKVTACGGGGGGGGGDANGGGGGGSGGYVKDINIPLNVSTIYVKLGSGGGGGGSWQNENGLASTYNGGGGGAGAYNKTDAVPGSGGSGGTYGGNGGGGALATTGKNGLSGNGTTLLSLGGGGGTFESGKTAGGGGRGSVWGGGGGGGGRTNDNTNACGGGGGGGGPTTISTAAGTGGTILFQIGGGGGGGGNKSYSNTGGGGGGGGGYGAGGGGGGGGILNGGTGGSYSSKLSALIGINNGNNGLAGQKYQACGSCDAGGGGGGSGYGGVSGTSGTVHVSSAHSASSGIGGTVSNIFGTNYCNGGKGGDYDTTPSHTGGSGKNGALRLYYNYPAIKCQRNVPANGGGGGGAGQIWIGEIDVTPKQTINIQIGSGGDIQTLPAANGKDGNATSIIINGTTYSVSGGKGGKYESDDTYISNSGGYGGGLKTTNFNSSARYLNWTKIDYKNGGKNGSQGSTISNGSGGGAGGTSSKLNGTQLNGGSGAGSQSDGVNAPTNSYGAGGGGGGGVAVNNGSPGYGGKGANGYIYIEWGGTNGSGGTAGEIVKKVVTNFDGDTSKRVMKIRIGLGGNATAGEGYSAANQGTNGNGGKTTVSLLSGGKTVALEARGGIKGNNGAIDTHGGEIKLPDNYNELYKEFVQGNLNIILGQKANDDYGGTGGYLACMLQVKDAEGNTVCSQNIKANDGSDNTIGPVRPGCGGSAIASPLYESICNAKSTAASPDGGDGIFGGGGGGGAVLNNTKGSGGKGGNGFVILEYKSTRLD